MLSGLQGLKKFYVRGTFKGDEVRILTILYDQAVENTVEPVVIAMSSAFNPFPAGAQAAGPPPRKNGRIRHRHRRQRDGAIIADRQVVDSCIAIAIPGHGNADRVAEDKEQRSRAAAHLRRARAEAAEPRQWRSKIRRRTDRHSPIRRTRPAATRRAASRHRSRSGGSDLSPAPGLGFSGAAALDSDGKFAGIALLKPVLVAGPANAAPQRKRRWCRPIRCATF